MKRGFTLIEMVVALMIFSIVVVVALAALTKIVDANRKAQTIHDAVSNMSFTMESMAREMRTGSLIYCRVFGPGADMPLPGGNIITEQFVSPCGGQTGVGNNAVGIAFLTSRVDANDSDCRLITAYELYGNGDDTFSLKKALQASCGAALSFSPVIDSDIVSINDYYIQISNTDYPLIFIKIAGIAGQVGNSTTHFSIQTASSPRLP